MELLEGVDAQVVGAALAEHRPVWVDLRRPTVSELAEAGRVFDIHPLALEDSREWSQRPKMEQYEDEILLVFYGVGTGTEGLPSPVEVHLHWQPNALITVHRTDLRRGSIPSPQMATAATITDAVHRVLDALTDSYLPALDDLEARIDALEEELLGNPSGDIRHTLLGYKRTLAALHQRVHLQRDMLATAVRRLSEEGRITDEQVNRFRDVIDHLWIVHGRLDTLRDHLQGLSELYLAALSNRLNITIKRLTVVATIFLPLSVVTGFFGMNFGWLVDTIASPAAFWFLGVGVILASAAGIFWWMWRAGALSDDERPPSRRGR